MTSTQLKCPECKYDLRGLMVGDQVRCPECDKLHTRQSLTRASWRLRWVFASLCLVPAIALPLSATTYVPPAIASLVFDTPLWFLGSLGCIILGSLLFVNARKCPPALRHKAVAYTIISTVLFSMVDAIFTYIIGMLFLETGLIHIGC